MAKGIADQYAECLENGKIKKLSGAKKLVEKEIRAADGDLDAAQKGLLNEQWNILSTICHFRYPLI